MQFFKRHLPFLFVTLTLLTGLWGTTSRALASDLVQEASSVYIYFFWGDGCPHCAEAKPFLEQLTQRYPYVQVESFEVWYDADNQALFQQMAAAHGFEPRYVPTIFVGEQHWEGFSSLLRDEIERGVRACVEGNCPDAGAGLVPGHEAEQPSEDRPAEAPDAPTALVDVYLFWGDAGCNDCVAAQTHHATLSGFTQFGGDGGGEALAFLRSLQDAYPGMALQAYEVWVSSTNGPRFKRVAEAYGVEARGVPTIFVGERVWEGFYDKIGEEIEAYIQECLDIGCPSPVDDDNVQPSPTPIVTVEPAQATPAASESASLASATSEPTPPATATMMLTLPLLGEVDLGKQSLWVSTALIGFVDGFNPCSLWVLSILIALTLRTGSRKKIFIIGLTFITVTALVYVLFIAGLFTMLTFVRFLDWIQAAVSLLALFFAVINIKDYFWYKEGVSFTIDDAQKPGLYKRMRRVMQAGDSLGALLLATVGLALGVSLVEFSCTAGFPVLWTNLVAAQNVSPATFALLLLLYMVIYQIDELGIFLAAVVTLRASKLEEKHGRILKLIGGTLMLTLAGVMLFKPALMNNLVSSLLIFGAAFGVALLVLLVHRVILPRFGIHIGTEADLQSQKSSLSHKNQPNT